MNHTIFPVACQDFIKKTPAGHRQEQDLAKNKEKEPSKTARRILFFDLSPMFYPYVSTVSENRVSLNGAGGGGRTRTVLPPTDFESVTSANSITPAHAFIIPHMRSNAV